MAKKKVVSVAIILKPIKNSSNISAIGYNPTSRILEIQFSSGGHYKFADVPKHEHDSLMKAKSKGRHFAEHIRDHYEFDKIT